MSEKHALSYHPDGSTLRQAQGRHFAHRVEGLSNGRGLKILLAVDGSPHSEAAVRLVTGMTWPAETSVAVLAVVPERWSLLGSNAEAEAVISQTLASLQKADWTAAEQLAGQVANRLRTRHLNAGAEVRGGRPSEVILQCAAEPRADLIVIGAKGLSAPGEFRMGSTAHKLAHYAECSVLVARPAERIETLSVILAADGSPEAQRATEFLCTLSLPQWAEVTVVSVAEVTIGFPTGERRPVADVPEIVRRALLDSAESRVTQVLECLQQCGAQVRSVIRLGHAAKEILATAQDFDADLIVVGAHGETRAEPFPLGGVAQKVVKYAPCSVLVVR